MRKVLAATLAVLTFGVIAGRAEAGPIEAFRKVAAGYDAFDNVRRCQFFDPGAGEWVEFWGPRIVPQLPCPGLRLRRPLALRPPLRAPPRL